MSARTECYLPVSGRGMELRHLSIDPFHALVAGHCTAVVAFWVELRASTDAARYLLHPHHPPPDANPAHHAELFPEVLEAGQPIGGGAVSQTGPEPPEERPPAGAGEVHIYLLLEAHVSNHCQTPSLNPTLATPVRRARGPQVRSG